MSGIQYYEPLWGSWHVDKHLGGGLCSKVYQVCKKDTEECGKIYHSAVKMLSIPYDEADIKGIRQTMPDEVPDTSIATYIHGFVNDIVQELDFINALHDGRNIVRVDDYSVIQRDALHWDILIRMELLKPLYECVFSPGNIVRMGIDIASALGLCAEKGRIHYEVKPDNILVSERGDFKLDIFSAASMCRNSEMSLKRNYIYTAPEVFYDAEDYSLSADLYSLGIIMYRYLNCNRIPFMPPFPEVVTPQIREDAIKRRMKGDEPLPDIPDVPPALNAFIMKACAYRPEERYQTAQEFMRELERAAYSMKEA